MLNLAALVAKTEHMLPERSSWLESMGVVLIAFGLFLGMATLTFEPTDYLLDGTVRSSEVANLTGPLGALISGYLLQQFGVVGLAAPVVFMVWGLLVTLGFVLMPRPSRLLALLSLAVISSAAVEIHLGTTSLSRPVFGFGGAIGNLLGQPMHQQLGYGGALVLCAALALMSLILTGSLVISRTASNLQLVSNQIKQAGQNFWIRLSRRGAAEEDLVKEALAAAALASQLKKVKIQQAKKQGKELTPEEANVAVKDLDQTSVKRVKAKLDELAHGQSPGEADPTDQDLSKNLAFYYQGPNNERPVAKLFKRSTPRPKRADLEQIAAMLTSQLAEFKIEGQVKSVSEGPVVTTFEFEPAPGTKVSKITGLADDLARMLQAKSLRILAPIPGKQVIGFEVPNAERSMIGFADLIDHEQFRSRKVQLPVPIGLDTNGKPIIEDLAKMPHLLVAGSTGSGKSVFMNTLIGGLICRYTAKDLRFIMIDPKMVELASYNKIPHMAAPVVTDPVLDAKAKLEALVEEMEDRFNKMRTVGARNLQGFNEIIKKKRKSEFAQFRGKWQTMPYIVLIIDELADMMMTLGKDAEVPITRLAQKARAAGIHLVIATQRPSAEVVTGLIKANFPTRVAFRVLSALDSRTIIDQPGADKLIGQGDMLFLNAQGCRRMHGAYLSDDEVHAMTKQASKLK